LTRSPASGAPLNGAVSPRGGGAAASGLSGESSLTASTKVFCSSFRSKNEPVPRTNRIRTFQQGHVHAAHHILQLDRREGAQ
jgi:hypothetical protein